MRFIYYGRSSWQQQQEVLSHENFCYIQKVIKKSNYYFRKNNCYLKVFTISTKKQILSQKSLTKKIPLKHFISKKKLSNKKHLLAQKKFLSLSLTNIVYKKLLHHTNIYYFNKNFISHKKYLQKDFISQKNYKLKKIFISHKKLLSQKKDYLTKKIYYLKIFLSHKSIYKKNHLVKHLQSQLKKILSHKTITRHNQLRAPKTIKLRKAKV